MKLLIITGLSGAGKSCVADAFEDIGWFCVDNLPAKLIPFFAERLKTDSDYKKVAVVTDIRAGLTVEDINSSVEELNKSDIETQLLFVDCKQDVLFTRYKQTRRSHPLMKKREDSLTEAIKKEILIFKTVKNNADYVIDTTGFSVLSTKQRIISTFSENRNKSMHIHCMSFGFKHGIPEDVDFMFDVRFLPNPFYVDELKPLTGLDEKVSSFVMDNQLAAKFEKHLINLIDFIVPECINEGRGQLVIAVGCTGGHHRSVTFAERIANHLINSGYYVSVNHRDIEK